MIGAGIATAACVAALLALVRAERGNDRRGRFVWKPIASAAFIAVPVVGGALSGGPTLAMWITAGLVLGAVGDVALMFDDERAFLAGLGAFLLGHVAYVIALATTMPLATWVAGVMIPVAIAIGIGAALVLRWLWPRLGSMRIPVIGYVAVISTMILGGIAASMTDAMVAPTGRALLTAGACAFYASDLAVAREKFVSQDPWNRTLGLPIYYAAQLLFGWAALCA